MGNFKTFIGVALSLCCVSTFGMTQTNENGDAAASSPAQASTEVDNTGINSRDKNNTTVTPQHQSNRKSDRKVLATVRKAVVRDKSLSTAGHNVKIMVNQGVVTLRGPVNNDTEKKEIEGIVTNVAGVSSIDNELEANSQQP